MSDLKTPAPFAERFEDLARARGPFCLGIDPQPGILASWGLPDDADGLQAFCDVVVEAAGEHLAVVKPQSAFFERFGSTGVGVLERLTRAFRAAGTLVLLDAKRGDIASTNAGYADGLLGQESPVGADAITVAPYLGIDALAPFFTRAAATSSAVFVVVSSSNPEGGRIQGAIVQPAAAATPEAETTARLLPESVAAHCAGAITSWNLQLRHASEPLPSPRRAAPLRSAREDDGYLGPIGAVVGGTATTSTEALQLLSHSLILAPGLGTQGGSFEEYRRRYAAVASRVLPSASRSVLSRGPGIASLRSAITEHCAQARLLRSAAG